VAAGRTLVARLTVMGQRHRYSGSEVVMDLKKMVGWFMPAQEKADVSGELHVYGWRGLRLEGTPSLTGAHQTREIVAARSQFEAARLAGATGPGRLVEFAETRNYLECKKAKERPGIVFWSPCHMRPREWVAADPAKKVG